MRSTRALIDTDALAWNYSVVRRRVGKRRMLAMVKANAYGHGMVGVARVLVSLGVDVLGVAFVDEAIELRRAGIATPIVVLTPFEQHEADAIIEHGLEVVIGASEQCAPLSTRASIAGVLVPVHVYVDTGMARDGVSPKEAVATVQYCTSLPGLHVRGLCTHFANADLPHDSYNVAQLEIFEFVLQQCANAGLTFLDVHAANTGAIWNTNAALFTMVRPGMSLYGYAPEGNDVFTLHPVMSLVSSVLSLRTVHAGDTVSYGRRWVAPQTTRIATIPIGYGDGFSRILSGKAVALIQGKEMPIVGTICMDECMVNVGDAAVSIGDEVVLLGKQAVDGHYVSVNAVDIAALAQTIPYEVTTAIAARVPRVFVGTYADVANDVLSELKNV